MPSGCQSAEVILKCTFSRTFIFLYFSIRSVVGLTRYGAAVDSQCSAWQGAVRE